MTTLTPTAAPVTTIKPLGDQVLLQIVEETVSAGGIIIPERARGNLRDAVMGRVIAVGPGRVTEFGSRMEVTVKQGDLVLLGRNGGIVIEHQRIPLRMVRDAELIGTVEESRIVQIGEAS